MPHTPGAWKRLRQAEKRRRRNRAAAKKLKNQRKAVEAAIRRGDAVAVTAEFKATQAVLDRAAGKGYIHPNKAARLKSRLAKRLRKTGSAGRAPKSTMVSFKPSLTPSQLAARRRAEHALAEAHPGQDVAFIDDWAGDTLNRVVVAASADPAEFQELLLRLDPGIRSRVQVTRTPDPADGLDVPSVQFT